MSSIKSAVFPKLKQHLRIDPASISSKLVWPKGVHYFPVTKHSDKRGFFMEVTRVSSLKKIGFVSKQISISETEPKVTKAFHFHQKQSDLFCPISGKFRIVLFDIRKKSLTFGHGFSIYTNLKYPFVLHIPSGVAHGYQVLGKKSATMLYIMNREYDPKDELRADWDDPQIGFPW
jgi:dTDP-4-dehydrorhamnose 3,5-epimerase